jgi:N6-adenosine-specific RNA methylase IME4
VKYQILTADPPWDFLTRSAKGRGKSPKYPLMGLRDLFALPVEPLLADNAALFLWVTWPFMDKAALLMELWGFDYTTLAFDWFKTTKHGKPAFGTGYYFRAGPEPCLLGVRGVMPVAVRNERNIIIAPAREHSRKPDEAYEKMEAVYPRAKYPNRLELFASQYSAPVARAHGFEVLGYDVDGRDIRQSLPELLGAGKE